MANRSIRELERLALVDYRFYLGTLTDYSGVTGAIVPGASPPQFKRAVGQAQGLEWDLGVGNQIATIPAVSITGTFAYELMLWSRSPGAGTVGRIIEPSTLTCSIRWNGASLRLDCGVVWNQPLAITLPTHILFTRDVTNNGYLYGDGVPLGSAAVGANNLAGATVDVGNRAALTASFDGLIYGIRIYDELIDPDEAARLYEHSRIQLWPGSPKRSGIVSPVV